MGKFYKPPKVKKAKTESNGVNQLDKEKAGNVTEKIQAKSSNESLEEEKTPSTTDNDNTADSNISWSGWKKTIRAILKEKGEDSTMLIKNLKKKLMKVLESNGFEVTTKEFDNYFGQYTKSRYFEVTDNKHIQYVPSSQRKVVKNGNNKQK